MPILDKPFVQIAIEQVDTVILDAEGIYDPEKHDRYETFDAARDAALTSIEVMIDEADYDGADHLEELERMHELLDSSEGFAALQCKADYQWFLKQLDSKVTAAA